MNKTAIAVALIFLASGAWLYLDCLNKQERGVSEQIHKGIERAREEGKKRAEARVIFERNIIDNLAFCQAAADKSKDEYTDLLQQTVAAIATQQVAPRKRGRAASGKSVPAAVPQAALDAAEKLLESAKTECQQVYDERLKKGV